MFVAIQDWSFTESYVQVSVQMFQYEENARPPVLAGKADKNNKSTTIKQVSKLSWECTTPMIT